MKDFDIQIQTKLCPKHKEFFEKRVKVKIKNIFGEYINPSALVELLKEIETCVKCICSTTFGKKK